MAAYYVRTLKGCLVSSWILSNYFSQLDYTPTYFMSSSIYYNTNFCTRGYDELTELCPVKIIKITGGKNSYSHRLYTNKML